MPTPQASPSPAAPDATDPPARRLRNPRRAALPLIVLASGLAARAVCILLAPGYSFLLDHICFMSWSDYAWQHGPTSLYGIPSGRPIHVLDPPWRGGSWQVRLLTTPEPFNYPPGACYVFWLQGGLWHALDHHTVTSPLSVQEAADAGYAAHDGRPITSRVANTRLARTVQAFPAMVAELLLAWGVAALVATMPQKARTPPAAPWRAGFAPAGPAAVAFALVWLGPPFFLNSSFWTQTDALVAAPLVWCTYLLLRERFLGAGALYGLALMLKAQAILLLPLLAFVGVCLLARGRRAAPPAAPPRGPTANRPAVQLLLFVGAAAGSIGLLALPFAGTDWFRRAYVWPVTEQYPQTTLYALNVWWIDLLLSGPDALDARRPVGPWSRDAVGRALLVLGIALSAAAAWWRWRGSRQSWVPAGFLMLYAAFLLPTRVHERYVYYCLPFLIAAVMHVRTWVPTLVVLFVLGSAEMTWFLWLQPMGPAEAPPRAYPQGQAISGLLALGAVLAYVHALRALLRRP